MRFLLGEPSYQKGVSQFNYYKLVSYMRDSTVYGDILLLCKSIGKS